MHRVWGNMEKEHNYFAEEYKALVKEYENLFNDNVPSLTETGWNVLENLRIIKECISTGKAYVHKEEDDRIY